MIYRKTFATMLRWKLWHLPKDKCEAIVSLSSSKRYILWDTSGFRTKVMELLLSFQTLQYPRIWTSVFHFSLLLFLRFLQCSRESRVETLFVFTFSSNLAVPSHMNERDLLFFLCLAPVATLFESLRKLGRKWWGAYFRFVSSSALEINEPPPLFVYSTACLWLYNIPYKHLMNNKPYIA